jgi:RNA recognition motif-containing protein
MTRNFVGNLSFEMTQSDLRDAFGAYGPLGSAEIVIDRVNGRSRGLAFVEMQWQAHAVAAIQGLNGSGGNPPRGWDVFGDARHRW